MRFLLEHLYPTRCIICHKKAEIISLCDACAAKLPWKSSELACTQCATTLPEKNLQCGICQREKPYFDTVIATFDYADPIAQFISGLKFHQKLSHAGLLGSLLAKKIAEPPKKDFPDCLIPVPLHNQRLRERGYNQSLEIARILHKTFKISLDYRSITRTKITAAQSSLPAKDRKQNVINAFSVSKKIIFPKHIALVDDVMTTGNTVNELSKVLKNKGVEKISVWCCAKT